MRPERWIKKAVRFALWPNYGPRPPKIRSQRKREKGFFFRLGPLPSIGVGLAVPPWATQPVHPPSRTCCSQPPPHSEIGNHLLLRAPRLLGRENPRAPSDGVFRSRRGGVSFFFPSSPWDPVLPPPGTGPGLRPRHLKGIPHVLTF